MSRRVHVTMDVDAGPDVLQTSFLRGIAGGGGGRAS